MVFKPIKCNVNIGEVKYFSNAKWFLHCWETETGSAYNWAREVSDFIQSMREKNISLDQIKNVGTKAFYKTFPLEDKEKLEIIQKGLTIPIIRVLKKYSLIENENEPILSHPYVIEMGEKFLDCKLKEVPSLLHDLGCKRNDVLFHRELSDPESYDNLNLTDRLYIEIHTLFRGD